MDHLFTGKQIQGKVIRLIFLVLFMWIIYVGYHFLNDYLNTIRDQSEVWSKRPLRFLFREIVVYFFGLLGYLYLRKEGFHPNFLMQFWLMLALLDILCLSIGVFREFVLESVFLHDIYNRIIDVIASPVYTICFIIYTLYFSYNNQKQGEGS